MDNILGFLDRIIDDSTYAHPAWNIEHKLDPNAKIKWNYVDGCMLKGIMEVYFVTKNQKYLDFVTNFIDFYVNEDGEILGYSIEEYNCDHINEGKILYMLYDIHKKEKYKKAIDRLYKQLEGQPRTKTGNFWHKKIYPNQIWLDGLYMAQPFLMEYTLKFNDKKDLADIVSQFTNAFTLTRDKETGLFYHGYDETREMFWSDKETGLSQNFWSRSIGWFGMALVDTLEKVVDQEVEGKDTVVGFLKDYASAVVNFIDKDKKMFWQVTDAGSREGNYLETSGSCAIAYTLMKASRLGFIDSKYFAIGEEVFDAINAEKLEVTPEKFVLKDICLVAGLGGMAGKGTYEKRDGTFEYYISEPIVDNDAKGVAPFLFAYAEKLRKNK